MKKRPTIDDKQQTMRKGVTSLATMLILGGIIVQIGLVGFALSYYLTASNAGVKFSSYALSAAQAGIAEGMLRVVRGEYSSYTSFEAPNIGGTKAEIAICTSPSVQCASLSQHQVQVSAAAVVFSKRAHIIAILDVHPITKRVSVISIEEKSL